MFLLLSEMYSACFLDGFYLKLQCFEPPKSELGTEHGNSVHVHRATDQESLCRNQHIENLFISMFYSYSNFFYGVNLTLSGSGSETPRRMRPLAVLAHQFIALALFYFPFSLILGQVGQVLKSKTLLSRKDMGRDGKPGK